jgi:hypothetical protein
MKRLVQSVIFLITSTLLLSAALFAWFTNSLESNIRPISGSVIKREINFDVAYGKNGGGYQNFIDPADINAYLRALVPGDSVDIKVVILNSNNPSDPALNLSIKLFNIRASETEVPYNLLDFYHIKDRTVKLTWYDSMADYVALNVGGTLDILLEMNDPTSVIYKGLPLEDGRLRNLFDSYVNDQDETIYEPHISIYDGQIPSGAVFVIEFSFLLDLYTPNGVGFHDGELKIDGLYSFYDE